MTITTRYGDRSEDDGTEFSASVLMGASNDRASITYALEYDKRDPIFDADREWTAASRKISTVTELSPVMPKRQVFRFTLIP